MLVSFELIRRFKSNYSILGINSCIKIFALNHHGQLFIDGLAWCHESSIQAIESYTRERDEVLDDALAPDQVIDVINMSLQVDVQPVIGAVCLENAQACRVSAVYEECDGTPNMGLEFEICSEVGILKHLAV